MRWLLLIAALLTTPAAALEYSTFNHSSVTLSGATAEYSHIQGATELNTTENRIACLIPDAITIVGLDVWLDTEPGAGKSREMMIRKDATSDEFGCTIANTATHCSATGSASFSAGEWAGIKFVPIGAFPSPNASIARWSVRIQTSTDYISMFCGTTTGILNKNTTSYLLLNGQEGAPRVDQLNGLIMPTAGTVDNLYVDISAAPGGISGSRDYEVLKDGSTTGLLCDLGTADMTCNDTTHSFSVAAGEEIILEEVSSRNAANATGRFAVRFTADRAGDVIVGHSIVDNLDVAANAYWWLSGTEGLMSSSEDSAVYQASEPVMRCYRMYMEMSIAAGGFGGSYAFTVRNGGADTDLTCAMPDPATACNDDGLLLIATGDNTYAMEGDPIGPGAAPAVKGSLVCEVPTRRRW